MASAVRTENGVPVGTSGGKYDSTNPVARFLIARFDRAVSTLAARTAPATILEVGCGEGHVTRLLLDNTDARILATDLSAAVLGDAEQMLSSPRVTYRTADLISLEPSASSPDLVVCCEVLEHLPDPHGGLDALLAQRAKWYLLSVPREPIWRILNFARGAYPGEWGNSPGHLQHWSKGSFLRFIGKKLRLVAVRSPLPWTVVLCRPHDVSV